eukprot:jgi/Galph1/5655/GphlegSOOS_G4233.1
MWLIWKQAFKTHFHRLLRGRLENEKKLENISKHIRCYSSSNGAVAFVFDIDGVLIRGKQILEPAKRAINRLLDQNGVAKYPFAFLTNGGGVTEAEKAKQISEWFDIPVHADQIVLSHSPMRDLVHEYNEQKMSVVCVGRGHPEAVASYYGFHYVVPIEEIGRRNPTATPFCDYNKVTTRQWNEAALCKPVGGVLVMSDSTDWGRDIQIICDICQNRLELPISSHPEIIVYFSNPDFLWANEYPFPRFGQGAFHMALQHIYRQLTGKELNYIQYGKPNVIQYRYMEKLLTKQAIQLGYSYVRMIYAIGDNPAADIRGARNARKPWIPILVRTGCFSADMDNDPIDPADRVFQDVDDAVSTFIQEASPLQVNV